MSDDYITTTIATVRQHDRNGGGWWVGAAHGMADRIELLEDALGRIDALDRDGHDSEVASEMGYIARVALGSAYDPVAIRQGRKP